MNKKIIFIGFALVLLSIPLYLMIRSENVLGNGFRHKIKLQAYDPFDPFRGKYLRMNYDNEVEVDRFFNKGESIYITLKKDSLGNSYFANGWKEKPTDTEDYFKTITRNGGGGELRFKTDNLSKYFINENKALKAETVIREHQQNDPSSIYVAIRILDGEVRLEDIFIEDIPLLDYLADH